MLNNQGSEFIWVSTDEGHQECNNISFITESSKKINNARGRLGIIHGCLIGKKREESG